MTEHIICSTVLAKSIGALHAASEFEFFAGSRDIVVDHVDEDSTAEKALLLELAVDEVEFLPYRLLLCIS